MPHVRRRLLIHLDAPPDRVREVARDALGLQTGGDRQSLEGRLLHDTTGNATLRVDVTADAHGGATAELHAENSMRVPFFQWFFRPVIAFSMGRLVRHAGDVLEATVAGVDPPAPPSTPTFLPAVEFTPEQMRLLASVCALGALAAYGSALFAQVGGPVRTSFHASESDLSFALAITRPGALLALMLVLNASLPPSPEAATATATEFTRPVVRIHSTQKLPERIVIDTSIPTIIPAPTVVAEAGAPAKIPALDALAQISPSDLKSADLKKPEPKLQPKRKIAKRHYAPPAIQVAQQPHFGFFANNTW